MCIWVSDKEKVKNGVVLPKKEEECRMEAGRLHSHCFSFSNSSFAHDTWHCHCLVVAFPLQGQQCSSHSHLLSVTPLLVTYHPIDNLLDFTSNQQKDQLLPQSLSTWATPTSCDVSWNVAILLLMLLLLISSQSSNHSWDQINYSIRD